MTWVVTGTGMLSSLGGTVTANFEAACRGETGLAPTCGSMVIEDISLGFPIAVVFSIFVRTYSLAYQPDIHSRM